MWYSMDAWNDQVKDKTRQDGTGLGAYSLFFSLALGDPATRAPPAPGSSRSLPFSRLLGLLSESLKSPSSYSSEMGSSLFLAGGEIERSFGSGGVRLVEKERPKKPFDMYRKGASAVADQNTTKNDDHTKNNNDKSNASMQRRGWSGLVAGDTGQTGLAAAARNGAPARD